MKHRRTRLASVAIAMGSVLGFAGVASATPIKMPTIAKAVKQERSIVAAHRAINPPAPPCPENGQLPSPFSNCGLPEAPATSLPYPTNMAFWGGFVQTLPKVYLIYWGWGQAGAFPGRKCSSESLTEGTLSAQLACDPDGAGKYMANFVYQMGGTKWSNVADQYFQTSSTGKQTNIAVPKNVLAGMWVDDTDPAKVLVKSNASNPPGSKNTYTLLAQEAQRAAAHFGVSGAALKQADFVVLQPPAFSDPNALASSYCAFHDYTLPKLEGGIYNNVKPGLAWTNMPYVNVIGGGADCGENSVNSGRAGKLDGFSIVLGHEIMETITDPGAEDITTSSSGTQTYYGGWYDTLDANENGDKCAWVGEPLITGAPGEPTVMPVPGAIGDIKGNRGTTFAVQSTWSNAAAGGTGYCAGVASTDLPSPLNGD